MGSFFEWMVESSLLVMMIMGIRKIFAGKIRYSIIYALWIVVLLRFMIPVNFVSTPFSVGNLIPGMSLPRDTYADKDAGFQEGNKQQDVQTAYEFHSVPAGQMPGKVNAAGGAKTHIDNPLTAQVAEGQPAAVNEVDGTIWMLMKYGRLAAALFLLIWFVWSNLCLIMRLRRSRTLYGQRGRVKIYVASEIKNPCLYGFPRPSIYIPRALISPENSGRANEEELAQIIAHEYVHYRHGDHIWAVFRIFLVCYYWFDPFLWLAVSCSKKDAELFCDETVIRYLGEKRRLSYGKMLVRLAQKANWCDFRYPIMSMSKKGKEMEQRIRAISRKKCYSRWVVVPLAVIVLAAAGITCSSGNKTLAGEETEAGFVYGDGSGVQNGGLFFENSVFDSYVAGSGRLQQTDQAVGELLPIHKRAIEDAFGRYVEAFTEAVNTGNVDRLNQVLAEGSDVYEQQCKIAKNYYGRGIREEVVACAVSSAHSISDSRVVLCSDEKIRVFYADATTKVINQRYCYTCEYAEQKWVIIDMEEIPSDQNFTEKRF